MTSVFRRIGFLLVAALTVAGLAFAQQGYDLQRKVKVDGVSRFRVKATLEMMGEKAVFNGLVTQKVTRVEPNGDFAVEAVESQKTVLIGSEEFPAEASPSSRTIYRSNGEIIRIEGRDAPKEVYRIANVNTFYAPAKQVAVGDTWSHEVKGDSHLGTRNAHVHYVVQSLDKLGEGEALRITFAYAETTGDNPVGAEGTVWISLQDGDILKREYTFKNFPSPDGSPIAGTMSIVRE